MARRRVENPELRNIQLDPKNPLKIPTKMELRRVKHVMPDHFVEELMGMGFPEAEIVKDGAYLGIKSIPGINMVTDIQDLGLESVTGFELGFSEEAIDVLSQLREQQLAGFFGQKSTEDLDDALEDRTQAPTEPAAPVREEVPEMEAAPVEVVEETRRGFWDRLKFWS